MVSRIYDQVADQYDQDWSGLYAAARAKSIEQIRHRLGDPQRQIDTVDLGVGTGNVLRDLQQSILLGSCTGFDISRGMLAQAARKTGSSVKLIHADAANATDYLQQQSQDLVLCHFLLSFMDMTDLLGLAQRLLRPGGLLSLATSTQESLSELHSVHFPRASRLIGVKASLRRASTPRNHQQCLQALESMGFEIVEDSLQRQAVSFDSFDDVRRWALDSGWAASFLDDPMGMRKFYGRLAFALGELFIHPFYPVDATNEISVVLARKPGPPRPKSAQQPVAQYEVAPAARTPSPRITELSPRAPSTHRT